MILGLCYPATANLLEPLITPALLLMMIFSMVEIDLLTRGELKGALIGLGLNYLVLSSLIIGLSSFLGDESLRQGFVVMAAVPPAVAVLPLTKLLKGDSCLSLYAETVCYLASLILMPGIIFAFTSRTDVSLSYISEISLLLILLPIIVSRFLRGYRLDTVPPINLGFFLVTYTVIGLNTQAIFGDVTAVALIAFVRTFVIGAVVFSITSLAGEEAEKRVSYTLLASFKNLGMAAAVSLILFGPKAGIPAAVCILAETSFYIFFAALRHHGILI
jgi:BASS family bile acid:Na+ symporter